MNLLDVAAIPGAVRQVLAEHGRIDALVNASGTPGGSVEILTQTEEDWHRFHPIDLKAPFRMLHEVARQMIERGRGGRIVNVMSSSGHRA